MNAAADMGISPGLFLIRNYFGDIVDDQQLVLTARLGCERLGCERPGGSRRTISQVPSRGFSRISARPPSVSFSLVPGARCWIASMVV